MVIGPLAENERSACLDGERVGLVGCEFACPLLRVDVCRPLREDECPQQAAHFASRYNVFAVFGLGGHSSTMCMRAAARARRRAHAASDR